jgi:nicotinamidase-related amidase
MHDPFYDLFPRPAEPPLLHRKVALLTIDLQYLDAHPDGWVGRIAQAQGKPHHLEERWSAIEAILPRVRMVQDAFRTSGQEVIHVRVAYRTADGRDAGRAYMPAPDAVLIRRDARDDELLPEVAPLGDEMVFSKTSASVFNSTELDSVMRRMGVDHLVFTGIVTDGCVELAARDAADRGYAVTLVTDACAASTREAHTDAIQRMSDGGFVAAKTAAEVAELVSRLSPPAMVDALIHA